MFFGFVGCGNQKTMSTIGVTIPSRDSQILRLIYHSRRKMLVRSLKISHSKEPIGWFILRVLDLTTILIMGKGIIFEITG